MGKEFLYAANLRHNITPELLKISKAGANANKRLTSFFAKVTTTAKQATGSVLGKSKSVDTLNKSIRTLPGQQAFSGINTGLKDTGKRAREAKDRFVRLDQSIDNLPDQANIPVRSPGLNHTTRKMQQLDRSILRMVRNAAMIAGLSFGLTGLAGSTVGKQAGFEKSLSNVQALSNATTEELDLMRTAARQAGETTEHFARSGADAMGFLAMAGQNTSQILRSLPATLNLASAGQIDLARAADISTNIMGQYGKTAAQTGEIVDKLAFTQSRFNTNIYEIADAQNYFGPTAKALNVALSESLATIGILSNRGLKGSLATRALGTSMVRLAKPTRQARDVMEKYNLTFFDAQGNFMGMANMVEMLQKRIGHLNPKQKQAALAAVFQAEAIQELNILLSAGADKIRAYTEELDHSQGAARRMANTKLLNLAGDWTKLQSASESYAISLGSELDPTLRRITRISTMFVRSLDTTQAGQKLRWTTVHLFKLSQGVQKNWGLIKGVAKAYVILRVATASYNLVLKAQNSLLVRSVSSFAMTRTGMVATSTAIKGATVAQQGFNFAMRLNPIGAVASVLATLASTWLMLRDNINKTTDAQQQFNLQAEEQKFLNREFKDQRSDADRFISLSSDAQLMDRLSNVEVQRRIQQGSSMLTYFQDKAAEARHFEKIAGTSGLSDAQEQLKTTRENLAQKEKQLKLLDNQIKGNPYVTNSVGKRRMEVQAEVTTLKSQLQQLLARQNQLRAHNPVLTNDPSASSATLSKIANKIKASIDGLHKQLPAEDAALKLDLSDRDELNQKVMDAMTGSAVGGDKRLTVHFDIREINNIVHASNSEEGAQDVIQMMMSKLLEMYNEAGYQIKNAIQHG